MKASRSLMEKVKEFEGVRLLAYQDSAGVWTIGYGHTIGVRQNMRISMEKADELLCFDMKTVEIGLNRLGMSFTQAQFDSLCSFVFNLGIGNLRRSTLLRKIRLGAPDRQIQAEFRKWVYAGGKRLSGLVKRREWEAQNWVRRY